MPINFSNLQAITAAAATDQIMIRLNNALSGADGFARLVIRNLENSLTVTSTVFANSGTVWNYRGSDVKALTGNWQGTFTTFAAQSGNNASVYTTVNANSATTWNYQGTDIRALTGVWQGATTLFAAQSAANISVYSTVNTLSSSWTGGGGGPPTFLSGGTVNQIFVKNSSTDYDGSWRNKRTSFTLGISASTGSITINSNALDADQMVISLSGTSLSAVFAAPTNPYDAQMIVWNVRYLTNISSVTLTSAFRTPITTLNWILSASRMDIFAAKYNALDSRWDVVSFAPGYPL